MTATFKPYIVTVQVRLDDDLEEGSVYALCAVVLAALNETGIRAQSIAVTEVDEP